MNNDDDGNSDDSKEDDNKSISMEKDNYICDIC